MQTFERGHFDKFSYLSSGVYVNICYLKYHIQDSNIFRTVSNVYDPSYFDGIVGVLRILQGVCGLVTTTVYICIALIKVMGFHDVQM